MDKKLTAMMFVLVAVVISFNGALSVSLETKEQCIDEMVKHFESGQVELSFDMYLMVPFYMQHQGNIQMKSPINKVVACREFENALKSAKVMRQVLRSAAYQANKDYIWYVIEASGSDKASGVARSFLFCERGAYAEWKADQDKVLASIDLTKERCIDEMSKHFKTIEIPFLKEYLDGAWGDLKHVRKSAFYAFVDEECRKLDTMIESTKMMKRVFNSDAYNGNKVDIWRSLFETDIESVKYVAHAYLMCHYAQADRYSVKGKEYMAMREIVKPEYRGQPHAHV